ncbi:septation protein A [Vibrio rarus]|uniref:septation protein A n=1 Tax=Vibrio rarus TaxID=413403 RepID=UPI0021C44F47|nr:septation protein A [Vibrio rarus]
MKPLFDFVPLIIFFILYKMYDIYMATGALVVATSIQLILTFLILKKVEKVQVITFIVVTIFGGLTLLLHDENFIKWKVTIIYSLFALGLTMTQLTGKPFIKGMLHKEISLPDSQWKIINWAWTLFFTCCALLNIYVAFRLPLDVWVDFKVFGLLAATLVFTLLTGLYIYICTQKESKKIE